MNLKSLKCKAAVLLAAAVVTGGVAADAVAQGQPQRRQGQGGGGGQGGGQPRERQPGNGGGQNRGPQDGGGRGGFGGGRMGGMMGPAVTSRQIEKYTKMLNLTKEQQSTLKMLHEGYSEQARATGEKARDEMQKLRDEMRDSEDREALMEKMQKSMREVRDARKKQDEAFTNDVKEILTPEQVAKWPTVERMQRRESSMRRGFISGERVDLVQLVDENKVSEDGKKAAAPVLAQYEEELDRELVKRNQWQEKQFEKMGEMRQQGDFDGIQKLIEEGRALDVKVRDVNRKYAKQVEGVLPEADKAGFQTAFKQASFPEVYRASQAQESIDAALKLKDLTPEQKESIAAIQATHEKTLNPLNEKLAAAIEEAEMNFNIGQMGRGGPGRGGDEESAAGKLRRERRDLDRSTVDSLKKVLTPAQVEKLPKREERGGGGGGGGGQRGRGNVNEEN